MEIQSRDGFTCSTDPAQMDVAAIHDFLSRSSYWAQGIPLARVQAAIDHSLTFGIFHQGQQVAFARIISDRATFAYLCDVYVLEAFRGRGLASWLMETIDAHPDLQGLRRWMLATRDAHALYARHGWKPAAHPHLWMERHHPDVYR